MIYRALEKDWTLAFPFSVKRALEEKYQRGFYGIVKMITPKVIAGMDLADLKADPHAMLEVMGDVRESVLVDMLEAGTEGMDAETAIAAYEELTLGGTFPLILEAVNGEQAEAPGGVQDDASRPAKAKKTQTKKPNG